MTENHIARELGAIQEQLRMLNRASEEAAEHRQEATDRLARIETKLRHIESIPAEVHANTTATAVKIASDHTRVEGAQSTRDWVRVALGAATFGLLAGGTIVAVTMRIAGAE